MFLRFVGIVFIVIGCISLYFKLITGFSATVFVVIGLVLLVLAQIVSPVFTPRRRGKTPEEIVTLREHFVERLRIFDMRKGGWKIAFFVCLVAMILSNLILINALVDRGISHSYLETSLKDQKKATEVLGGLIVNGGWNYSSADTAELLRKEYPKGAILEQGSTVSMGVVSFVFKDGKLIEVR